MRSVLFALCAVLAIIVGTSDALAAAPYLEFSPDYREPFLTSTATWVEEVFLPLNEYLSGFDFWVSNASQPATVTFALMTAGGAALSSRTVTIGPVPDSDAGQRYTVTLPAQIAVTPAAPYRISIQSTSPTLRLYWALTNQLLAHNAPPPPAYSSGTARIDGTDRAESFLYALYETSESSAPVISDVAVQQPLTGTARIVFHANEPVDAQLRYGITGYGLPQTVPFTGGYRSCVAGIQECALDFAVTPGTPYQYELTARDVWGNTAAVTGEFTSVGEAPSATPTPPSPSPSAGSDPTPPADTAAPVISNARTVNVTATSAGIAWTTDEAANSLVVVQLLPFLISAGGGNDSTFELEHLIPVANLDPGAGYLARITTSDAAGNITAATVSFSTLSATPTPGPDATPTPAPTGSPTATPTPSISIGPSDGQTTAQWAPPAGTAPTDGYRIDIIGPDGKLIRTIRSGSPSADLGEIPDGATVIVYADNGGVYEKVAAPRTVHWSALERFMALLPYVLGGLVLAIAGIIGGLKYRAARKKPAPPPVPPQPLSGAQPNPSPF